MINSRQLKELFVYRDGDLLWKSDCGPGRPKAGVVAGSITGHGHIQTKIGGRQYLNHRLIWLWHYGYTPEKGLDHIDMNMTNNRIDNLREASQSCNMRNTGNYSTNRSGVKGVCMRGGSDKWTAQIKINNKSVHLGSHRDFAEAVCHRLAAEQAENWAGCGSSSPAYKYVCEVIQK